VAKMLQEIFVFRITTVSRTVRPCGSGERSRPLRVFRGVMSDTADIRRRRSVSDSGCAPTPGIGGLGLGEPMAVLRPPASCGSEVCSARVSRHVIAKFIEFRGLGRPSCDEQPDPGDARKVGTEDGGRRAEVRARGEQIIDEGNDARCRFGQRFVDAIERLDLGGPWSNVMAMRRFRTPRLRDELANIERRFGLDGAEHPRQPVVAQRVGSRLRGWDRHEGQPAEGLGAQRAPECVGGRPDGPLLVAPLRPVAAVHWLLEVEDEIVGGPVGIATTRGVFADEVAGVVRGQRWTWSGRVRPSTLVRRSVKMAPAIVVVSNPDGAPLRPVVG